MRFINPSRAAIRIESNSGLNDRWMDLLDFMTLRDVRGFCPNSQQTDKWRRQILAECADVKSGFRAR